MVTCAALAIATTVLCFAFIKASARSSALAGKQAQLCLRTTESLRLVVGHPPPYPLNAWSEHFLDQSLSQFCLGKANPVSDRVARDCWTAKGDEECWREVYTQLLALYGAHERNWATLRP